MHEVTRAFGDRLIGSEERRWLETEINELALRKLCYSVPSSVSTQEIGGACKAPPVLWGDWFIPGQKTYREAPAKPQLLKLLQAFNEETITRLPMQCGKPAAPPPPVVFFSEMIEHIVALCRVLKNPKGHAALLGFGATGKQTVARLAACIRDFELVRQPFHSRKRGKGKAVNPDSCWQ